MRTLLFFDLPSTTSAERRSYRKFVKLIKENGFIMIQESVYSMLALNQQYVDQKTTLIRGNLPPEGSVMTLTITEKQFSSLNIMLGEFKTDIINSVDRTIVL